MTLEIVPFIIFWEDKSFSSIFQIISLARIYHFLQRTKGPAKSLNFMENILIYLILQISSDYSIETKDLRKIIFRIMSWIY